MNRIADRYIALLSQTAREVRQFTTWMVSPEIRSAMLDENSRLRREGWDPATIPHPELALGTLRDFFLPLFAESQSCILYGCAPSDLAGSWPGLSVRALELGVEIRPDDEWDGKSFPFWSLSPNTPYDWCFLISCDVFTSLQLVETILERGFNPFVVSNPNVLKYEKMEISRGKKLCLRFNLVMMYVSVTASPDLASHLCEVALRRGRIAAPYDGLGWDDDKLAKVLDKQAPTRKYPRKYRYTGGRLPPSSALEVYPCWMPALDEEGDDGQDESTIRPDDQQDFIGEFAVYTAADAELADGRTVPALLGQPDATFLHKDEVDVIIVYEGKRHWRVDTYDHDASWQPAEEGPTKRHGNTKVFPMRVRSRLPLERPGGPHIVRVLTPDGRLLRDAEQA